MILFQRKCLKFPIPFFNSDVWIVCKTENKYISFMFTHYKIQICTSPPSGLWPYDFNFKKHWDLFDI